MADDNLIPCEKCDTLIEGKHTHRLGPIEIECKNTHCKECDYQEEFRLNHLVRRQPYKDPFPRPGDDGRMPKVLRDALAKEHEERKRP